MKAIIPTLFIIVAIFLAACQTTTTQPEAQAPDNEPAPGQEPGLPPGDAMGDDDAMDDGTMDDDDAMDDGTDHDDAMGDDDSMMDDNDSMMGDDDSMGNDSMMGDVKEFTLSAARWEFTPDTVTVQQGDNVKITIINTDTEHNINIPEYGVSGEVVEFTADIAGTFTMFCDTFCGSGHQGMQATLVVQEAGAMS